MATDYNLLGSAEVLKELQEGRTRELLLLLQDKPVPEVIDPLNIQDDLSRDFMTDSEGDYLIADGETLTLPDLPNTDTLDLSRGCVINPNENLSQITATLADNTANISTIYIYDSGGTLLDSTSVSSLSGTLSASLSAGSDYFLEADNNGSDYTIADKNDRSYPITGEKLDVVNGSDRQSTTSDLSNFASISTPANKLFAEVTDRFAPPTTPPADFKAWQAIQAKDVTTGGSTSADPVEFEILDSTDTALNSSKISKARIADEPFTMRNRVYSESAASNGQSDYQIATTGDGGHFGIPVLTVVSVKKNGSVLDSANWSFDGTDTVTIDTSNVSIASGDTIDIKYDFDVFDSTLQPRAYLNRESASETSPSISHFRYEYAI